MDQTPAARPGSLAPSQEASITWQYIAPRGVTLEMCRRPDYWRNNARECGHRRVVGQHSWNKLEIIAEDGSWEALLRIVSVSDGLVHTRVLSEWHPEARPGRKPALPDGYVVEHIPGNGWRVLDPNGEPVAFNLMVEDEAVRAASAHSRKVAA